MKHLRAGLLYALVFALILMVKGCGGGGHLQAQVQNGSTPEPILSPAPVIPPAPPSYAESPFGFHPALPCTEASAIGIRWSRGADCPYLFWSLVDPDRSGDPARFRWQGTTIGPGGNLISFDYDRLFLTRDAGLNVLQNIAVEPLPQRGEYSLPGSWRPVCEDAYRVFVKEAVRRYSFIRHWQAGNEPNIRETRDLTDYAYFQRITYEAIKEQDSGIQVLLAGLAGNMDDGNINDTYYEDVLPELQGRYFDIYDIHFYGDARGGTTYLGGTRMLGYQDFEAVYAYHRNLLNTNGYRNTPVWVTEMGTPAGTFVLGPFSATQTEAEQARDLVKLWVLPLSLGIKKVFWAFGLMEGFKGDNGFFDFTGLIYSGQDGTHGQGEKKLAYYTHRLMTDTLEGCDWGETEKITEGSVNKTFIFRFKKNGHPIWICWWDNTNDIDYPATRTREIVVTGLQGSRILLTEMVPAFPCGTGVTEYETAFPGSSVEIHDGRATITVNENPVIVREQ